jgi:pilus assembly protein CpaD
VSTPGGLSAGEQARLKGWFEAMNLKYGDRISLDDPLKNPATSASVSHVASHFGLELAREVPVTEGAVGAGTVRITITRASATVPAAPIGRATPRWISRTPPAAISAAPPTAIWPR